MREANLTPHVVRWLEGSEWEAFHEVTHPVGPRADLVLRRRGIIWVMELKTSFSLDLMAQAAAWRPWAHYVSVVTPRFHGRNRARAYAMDVLKRDGIGVITVGVRTKYPKEDTWLPITVDVEQLIAPAMNRRAATSQWKLHDGYNAMGVAGNAEHRYWTAFRQTSENIREFLRARPGATIKEIVTIAGHHYRTDATARGALSRWIACGKIKGVRVDAESRPARYYAEEDV